MSKTTKHQDEYIIDSLHDQFFGLKYELDEKAKKYRNIIKEKIRKAKNTVNPFEKTKSKLSLPNIGGDNEWNALTQVDDTEASELKREFTADTHRLMGNILEPNDIGYGDDIEGECDKEDMMRTTKDFKEVAKKWEKKNLLLNEERLV